MQLRLTMFLTALFILGCQKNENLKSTEPQVPIATATESNPETLKVWGSLNCQKQFNCKNAILNIDLNSLQYFFSNVNSHIVHQKDQASHISHFKCGINIRSEWNDVFLNKWITTEADEAHLRAFLKQTINLQTCQSKEGIDTLLKTYFQNSKEFKNEYQ